MYRHASLGATAPAFCVNYAAVRVNHHQWRIGEPRQIMRRHCVKMANDYLDS